MKNLLGKKVGILGGTFDPIHNAHISMALFALENFDLDEVVLLVSGNPPHKTQEIAPKQIRFKMATFATQCSTKLLVSTIEIDQAEDKKIYTVESLGALKKQYQDVNVCAEFFYIIGEDTLHDLKNWYKIEEVLKLTNFICFERIQTINFNEKNTFLSNLDFVKQNFSGNVHNFFFAENFSISNISSTCVRKYIAAENFENLYNCVDKHVAALIINTALYSKDYKKFTLLKKNIFKSVGEKRAKHLEGVIACATELAIHYNENVSNARFAALIHDCAKNISFETSISILKNYNVAVDEFLIFPNIVHAKLGAIISKTNFQMNDEICGAIEKHTTAEKSMSALDIIIYLSDIIEINRSYDGVEKIRLLSKISLEKAFLEALNQTIEYLIRQNMLICEKTISARNNVLEKNI